MRPKLYDIDLDDVDANGLFTIAAIAGAGALTLDGALAGSDFDYARRIGILSAGNDSGITFTIVGVDANGNALTEIVTGANASTAESTGYFKSVTSITASGASAGNVTIGTVDEISTQTIPLNWRSENGATVAIDVTGTISYTLEETFEPLVAGTFPTRWTSVVSSTFDNDNILTIGATAMRLTVASYSSGAEIQMSVAQSGGC